MKSILDRQVKGVEGANVGVTNPSDGNYYTVEGSADSPFDSNDHMETEASVSSSYSAQSPLD